ncbi:uncharacterized protein CLUP02_01283 [Colletotrichum lupini]|uniref:Uncharacterized protein n=1 Tax=Colletotrichum lupini TaxID=145971 RepID=A0A9Q8W9J7_9PEZI|nr:uncharacterized protein CLUP02_01283 [Colletotrichum lupini]UQC74632.1 hypothetical protein CLUP02_01283 [Colletotrichum lupini]
MNGKQTLGIEDHSVTGVHGDLVLGGTYDKKAAHDPQCRFGTSRNSDISLQENHPSIARSSAAQMEQRHCRHCKGVPRAENRTRTRESACNTIATSVFPKAVRLNNILDSASSSPAGGTAAGMKVGKRLHSLLEKRIEIPPPAPRGQHDSDLTYRPGTWPKDIKSAKNPTQSIESNASLESCILQQGGLGTFSAILGIAGGSLAQFLGYDSSRRHLINSRFVI